MFRDSELRHIAVRTPPGGRVSDIGCLYISDGLVWSVPCLAHMTIECRDCPGSGHVGAGVSRVCLPWDCGRLYAGASGFLPNPKVETNERDGKSQWITVRVWIGTHPTCQTCRPVLTGEITLRCCIDSPSGCFNVLSPQGARLAIHVSLPTRENARSF